MIYKRQIKSCKYRQSIISAIKDLEYIIYTNMKTNNHIMADLWPTKYYDYCEE